MNIQKILDNQLVTIWKIDQPPVTARDTSIDEITFKAGDRVSIASVGGCVQTGGVGKTWKRYVNPSGPNSDHLYHGLIALPGIGLTRIEDFLGRGNPYKVPQLGAEADMRLHLGYEDDDYSDNGYWDHDDGNNDQCKLENDGGPAYIELLVSHPTP